MGGRLIDWIASGDYADRPLPAAAVANIAPGGTAIYFSSDTTPIMSVLDPTVPDWFEIDFSALTAPDFQGLTDVDWSTPPTDGQYFEWDTTSSKLVPVSLPAIPTQYTDEMAQDAVGAAIAAGGHTGITINYDDGGNAISFTVTITQYTDEMAQDSLGAAFAAGTHIGITVAYDDVNNKFSFEIREATDAECWAATVSDKVVTPKKIADMSAFVTVNDVAGTLTIDGDTGFNFKTTLDTATTFSFTNMFDGQSGVIEITQDATGGRVATWDSDQRFPSGSATNGVLSTGANKVDLLSYIVRGTVIHCSLMKDMLA